MENHTLEINEKNLTFNFSAKKYNIPNFNSELKKSKINFHGFLGNLIINNNEFIIILTESEYICKIKGKEYFKIKNIKILFTKITDKNESLYIEKILKDLFLKQNFYFTDLFEKNDYSFNCNLFSEEFESKYGLECPKLKISCFLGYLESEDFGDTKISLIVRRSCLAMGTRFLSRGLKEPIFHPTNNSELKLIIEKNETIFENIQLRGSIPLFWSQDLTSKYNPPIKLPFHTKNKLSSLEKEKNYNEFIVDVKKEMTANEKKYSDKRSILVKSFEYHTKYKYTRFNEAMFINYIRYLEKIYDNPIVCFANLIKPNSQYEGALFTAYDTLIRKIKLMHINYDISNDPKSLEDVFKDVYDKSLPEKEKKSITGFLSKNISFNNFSIIKNNKLQKKQQCLIRTNCIDSSDRTTHFQIEVMKSVLVNMRRTDKNLVLPTEIPTRMFVNAGKALSLQYTGTESLLYPFTKLKKDLIYDGIKSIQRYFINRYFDGEKNDAYKIFTGEIYAQKFKMRKKYNFINLFYWLIILPFIFLLPDVFKTNKIVLFSIFIFFTLCIIKGLPFNMGNYIDKDK